MDEVLDVINEEEEVVGHASKEEIHQKKLLHKAVHILIIDSLGRIFCRYRAKHISPAGWTSSVGRHVKRGQTFDQAAKESLQQTLGLRCPLILIGKIKVVSSDENEIVAVYTGYSDEVSLSPASKETGRFFTIEDIKNLFETQKATPHLVESFNLYLKNN